MSEKEKMLQGMIYDPSDEEVATLRHRSHHLCQVYNTLDENDPKRSEILQELMPGNPGVYFQGPIYFDYGCFIKAGPGTYANFNFVVLDVCPVTIGKNVFFGPNVSLVPPIHPLIAEERIPYQKKDGTMTDQEYGAPITIGDNVWVASNVTIVGGVKVGEGAVIGAGSVVIHDVEAHSFVAGNPARFIRKITPEDSIHLKKGLF